MKTVGSDRRYFRPPIRAEPGGSDNRPVAQEEQNHKKKGKIQMGDGLAVVAIQRFFYTLCIEKYNLPVLDQVLYGIF